MNWLTSDWRAALIPSISAPALMIVAMVCGTIIGLDREKREKAAGLRTMILVCLGSTAFTLVSFVFTSNTGDAGRVAAQIVTGIGFLGAGVILHGRGSVSGTTTAATIWVTASVGVIAGAGYAGGALGMSILVRLVLTAISIYEDLATRLQQRVDASLDFDPGDGRTRVRLERILVDYRPAAVIAEWQQIENGLSRLKLKLHLPRHHLRELLDALINVPEVRNIREEHVD
ncbi:MAG: MgtC/SapB family protein [Verrucomicrobiota bacterium]